MVLYYNIVFFIGRLAHSSVVLPDGSVLELGGYSNIGKYSNEVWRSSDKGANWALLTNTAWGTNGGKYFLIVSGYLSP